MPPTKVFFYVQHLIGIGHVRRAATLTRALVNRGFDVDFVIGGRLVNDIDIANANLIQLPAAKITGSDFDRLLTEDGRVVDDVWWEDRRSHLLRAFDASHPDVIITETYPFGRRQFQVELLPLLDAAKSTINPPLVVASIRDILQPKRRAGRNEEIRDIVTRYYDLVLIHGDPGIAALGDTFTYVDSIKEKLHYTGYVVDLDQDIDRNAKCGQDEVIVSAGGGAIGELLLTTAIEARPLSTLENKIWRILIGPNLDKSVVKKLEQTATSGIIVEPNRADFRELLSNCLVSVSQGGYNTVMDVLRTNVRSVMVPYVLEREIEQVQRVKNLATLNRVQLIEEKNLTADLLAKAVDDSQSLSVNEMNQINVNGAKNSVKVLESWLKQLENQ